MSAQSTLLSPPALNTLGKTDRVALFLDFDGTLVELAQTPDSIAVAEDLASNLAALSAALNGRLALVSGRAVGDLEKHLGPLPIAVAGSHGADIRSADGVILGDPAADIGEDVRGAMRDFAETYGLSIEEKAHGVALHFRQTPSKEAAAQDFAREIANANDLAIKQGKCVVELVKKGANKGSAVKTLMANAPFNGAVPWFIGDDITDEDGFKACQNMHGGGIVVGKREETRASHALANVSAVHQWLGF